MDPSFAEVSVVVLDEVHEDAADLYFLFSVLKKALERNSELKVVLMSAKVDAGKVSGFFGGCRVVELDVRSHRIDEFHEGVITTGHEEFLANALDSVYEIHNTTPVHGNSDILVFLPTTANIDHCVRKVTKERISGLCAFGLHSNVTDKEKDSILARVPLEEWREIRRRSESVDMDEEGDVEGDEDDVCTVDEYFPQKEDRETLATSNILPIYSNFDVSLNRADDITPFPLYSNVTDMNMQFTSMSKVSKRFEGGYGDCDESFDDDSESDTVYPDGERFVKKEDHNVVTKHWAYLRYDWADDVGDAIVCSPEIGSTDQFHLKDPANPIAIKNEENTEPSTEDDDNTRRVIFCTNIAETSLTFPRIGYVVDVGLQVWVERLPIMNIQRKGLRYTTKVSALQRMGRAGRLGPGTCYRLYSEEDAQKL
ncbi:hypothetical protein BC829DRAFT_64556 [Chytridium lagenaria]|nr:hypothetical protein BC829DRAFT_64556 [Chytridium lagenaria]